MIKLVQCWKYNPDIPREEAEKHYVDVHTQIGYDVLKGVPGFLMYKQNKVIKQTNILNNDPEQIEVEPDHNRSVELYFTDWEAVGQVFNLNRPEGRRLWDDHPNFMDCKAGLRVYQIEENLMIKRHLDGGMLGPLSWR